MRQAQGDLDAAIAAFDRALAIAPPRPEAFAARAAALWAKGDLRRAEADCDAAIKIDPRCVEALANRGALRQIRGDFEGAIQDYQDVLDAAPADWPLRDRFKQLLRDAQAPKQ